MKKKLLSALLCLCLVLAATPALAAPTRDIQSMDVLLDTRLQTLVEIMVTAIPEECFGDASCTVLSDGHAPGKDLVERVLDAAVMFARPTTFLTWWEAKNLYRQLFTNGELDLTKEDRLVFLTATEEGLEAHPEIFGAAGSGAYIYSASFDGEDLTLLCDLYNVDFEDFNDYLTADVESMPESVVTWVCNVALSLRQNPETEFGYTLNSLAVSPIFWDGNLSQWLPVDNTQYEYSVNLPSGLGLSNDDPAHLGWQSADGSVNLTLDVAEESLSYDSALSRFVQEHPGLNVQQAPEFGYFYAMGTGEFLLIAASEDLNWTYTLTLRFPPERQAEYSLYAEFIRNSMIVWGLSNG